MPTIATKAEVLTGAGHSIEGRVTVIEKDGTFEHIRGGSDINGNGRTRAYTRLRNCSELTNYLSDR